MCRLMASTRLASYMRGLFRGLALYVVFVALAALVVAGLIANPLLIMGDLDL